LCCNKQSATGYLIVAEAPVPLERHLVSQLASIAKRITELTEEQRVLQRLLERVRRTSTGNMDVTRKNSHARIIAERAILQSLGTGVEVKTVQSLFLDAQLLIPELNASTFRSYLRRLERRGLIQQAGSRGGWAIKPSG
jgi:hypothetical protein